MFREVWYCWQSTHEHSTEWEAENCTELYEQLLEALGALTGTVREMQVEDAVNQALVDVMGDDDA